MPGTDVTAQDRRLSTALVCTALAAAVIGSVGAPLITAVASGLRVSLGAAQWTLTITLFTGAIASPALGRFGSGPYRRATILGTLALVTVGGVLTVLPLPFGALLIGRGLQGFGVAAGALLMSVARAHLPSPRSESTIAALSVAATVGIGVGYPVISLVDQLAGLRAAYGLGVVLSAAALVIAWRTLPEEAPGSGPGSTCRVRCSWRRERWESWWPSPSPGCGRGRGARSCWAGPLWSWPAGWWSSCRSRIRW